MSNNQVASPMFVNRYFFTRPYTEFDPETGKSTTRPLRDVGVAAVNAKVVEILSERTKEEKDENLHAAGRNRRGPVGYSKYITGTVKVDRGGLVRFTAFDEACEEVANLKTGDIVNIWGTLMGNQNAGIKAINVVGAKLLLAVEEEVSQEQYA